MGMSERLTSVPKVKTILEAADSFTQNKPPS